MKRLIYTLVLSLCALRILSNPVDSVNRIDNFSGRKDSVSVDTFDFFSSDNLLEMSINFDLKEFLRTRKQPEYIKAAITISDTEGMHLIDSIKIKARGNMRRMYCQIPPIMLKFKNDNSGILYNGKLKLVIPCMNSEKYEDYVLKEYLVYRLYNKVSPYSLKTRLLRVTLNDSKKESRSYSFYAFLIENEKDFANRNNAFMVTHPNLGQKNMEADIMIRIAVFNYMIGNTDWSVPTQHNIKVIKPREMMTNKGIPVAYDFDYAGLVNPPYAVPAKELPITEVKERYYLGLCDQNDQLYDVVNELEGLKEEFLSTVSGFSYLSEYERKITTSYLNSFYRMMRNKNSLINTLSRACK